MSRVNNKFELVQRKNKNHKNNKNNVKNNKNKKSKNNHENNNIQILNLKSYFNDGYCIFHFLGKCKNINNCTHKHMNEKSDIYLQLRRIIIDPTKIPYIFKYKNQIIQEICKLTNFKLTTFLTSCTYFLRDIPCNNIKEGRYIKFNLNFNNKDIPIYICYLDPKNCRTRLTCGFHLDLDIKIQHESVIGHIIKKLAPLELCNHNYDEPHNELDDEYKYQLNDFPQLNMENKNSNNRDTNIKAMKDKIRKIKWASNETKKETKTEDKNIEINVEQTSSNFNCKHDFIDVFNKQKYMDYDIRMDLDFSNLNNKSKNELQDIITKLVSDNITLFRRNSEFNHIQKMLDLPIYHMYKDQDAYIVEETIEQYSDNYIDDNEDSEIDNTSDNDVDDEYYGQWQTV